MAARVNIGAKYGASIKETAVERHQDQADAARLIATAPDDAGELYARADSAADDMESDRPRHEEELATSTIQALQILTQALKAKSTETPGKGNDRGQDLGYGYDMSKQA